MDAVVRRDVCGPAALKPGDRLLRRQRQVLTHLGLHPRERPVARIDARQQGRDVVRVALPACLRVGQLRLVAGLGGGDHVGGDQDVLPELRRQRIPGCLAVEGLDRVAEVRLVSEQAADRRRRVRRPARQADDREPRPGDVVLPEDAHVGAELRRGLARRVAVRMRVVAVRDRQRGEGGEERDQQGQGEGDRPRGVGAVHVSVPFGWMRERVAAGFRSRLSAARRPTASNAFVARARPSTASGSGCTKGSPVVVASA